MPIRNVLRLPGGIRVDCAGESFHLAALLELTGGQKVDSGHLPLWAQLVPEPENPYDPNAVRIEIGGKPVGHLNRPAAAAFQPVVGRLMSLDAVGECMAEIVGSGSRYGVFLDLAAPTECIASIEKGGLTR